MGICERRVTINKYFNMYKMYMHNSYMYINIMIMVSDVVVYILYVLHLYIQFYCVKTPSQICIWYTFNGERTDYYLF